MNHQKNDREKKKQQQPLLQISSPVKVQPNGKRNPQEKQVILKKIKKFVNFVVWHVNYVMKHLPNFLIQKDIIVKNTIKMVMLHVVEKNFLNYPEHYNIMNGIKILKHLGKPYFFNCIYVDKSTLIWISF